MALPTIPPKDFPQITDYYDFLLSYMMEQYKNSPLFDGVLDTTALQSNDLEQALWEIRDLFYLSSAEGVQLDIIGKIFGLNRNGSESDTDFRQRIKLTAAARFSGTPDEIIQTVQIFFGATTVSFIPLYPAGFALFTDVSLTKQELEALSPAGVGVGEFANLVDAVNNPITDFFGNYIYSITLGI